MTALVAAHVDLAGVVAAAGGRVAAEPWSPEHAIAVRADEPVTVALAAGQGVQLLVRGAPRTAARGGCRRRRVRPADRAASADTAAVVLPGGFPEEFGAELSANEGLRHQIAELAAGGAPVHAEVPGWPIWSTNSTDIRCAVCSRARLDSLRSSRSVYRDAVAPAASSLYEEGERAVGHEFHRTAVTFTDSYQSAWVFRGRDAPTVRDGAVHGGVHASYLHTHPAARPQAVTRFVAAAATSRLAG